MSDLISPEYRALQIEMHGRPRGYGGGGHKHAREVVSLGRACGAHSLLDYGCGQATLVRAVLQDVRNPFAQLTNYDPALPDYAVAPNAHDIVVCTDVMEHVEPNRVDAVLADIRALTLMCAHFVIATRPANKLLADGRNAHLNVWPSWLWGEKLRALNWTIVTVRADDREVVFRCHIP